MFFQENFRTLVTKEFFFIVILWWETSMFQLVMGKIKISRRKWFITRTTGDGVHIVSAHRIVFLTMNSLDMSIQMTFSNENSGALVAHKCFLVYEIRWQCTMGILVMLYVITGISSTKVL